MKREKSSSLETGSTGHGSSGSQYEVFLSFRGPDTRSNFTDSLYQTLRDKCISVFIDKEGINVGEEIGPEIFQAIYDSKICIPIFSTDYASSIWCLRELEYMMECRKTNKLEVMPIFYNVEPSDVKLQTRLYKDALARHEAQHGTEVVQRWAEALKEVGRIKGWDTKIMGHGGLTRLIAQELLIKLKLSCVHIYDHLVGMDESVNEVVDLLNVESEDIRLIGICGMGGIGKTTLAKVICHKLYTNFKSHSFISNIRESDLLNVQSQLVYDIIGERVKLFSIDHGKNMIQHRFCREKVLIFLDDVNHTDQLMALAAKKEWFGSGSRIVVTTRDNSIFRQFRDQFEHCLIYEAKELNDLVALQLFSKHAFKCNSPPDAFLSLCKKVTARARGLPLAIEVIGSFLHGKGEPVWQDTLQKMDCSPLKDLKKNLMLSYEALDHQQKQIFLDIACYLAEENKSYAYYMWHDIGFFPDEGIDVLLSLSLVKIGENNKLWMHDQLKDLGRSIVFQENCGDPGKRSRVWNHKEAFDMIKRKKGTETVVALNFCGSMVPVNILTPEDFIKMPNIRFLKLLSWTLSGGFKDLFSELKWLSWYKCPRDLPATDFCPKNLVVLDLTGSRIDEHWGGWTQLKVATGLKVLNLSYCDMLKEIPDLSAFSSLEILILQGCCKLMTLPDSIGMLQCLAELDVSCTCITGLPNTIVNLKRLKVLKMNESYMQKLPEAIEMMEKLEEIYGENCRMLKMIPGNIGRLLFLKILKLTRTRVKNVPKLPESLVSLCLSSSATQKVSEMFNPVNLSSLSNLELCFGEGDDETFVNYKSECQPMLFNSSLRMKLSSIASGISFWGWLYCTRELELFQCKTLWQIQQLPFGLRKLRIKDCSLLEVVDLSNLENLLELSLINNEICDIQGLEGLASLQCLEVCHCRSSKFSGLERLKNLRVLKLEQCPSLQTLPDLSNFKNLNPEEFMLRDCPKLVEIIADDRFLSLDWLRPCLEESVYVPQNKNFCSFVPGNKKRTGNKKITKTCLVNFFLSPRPKKGIKNLFFCS